MKIKKGVVLAGLKIEMRKVLINAYILWKKEGKELVITRGLDGTHSAGSLHYYGYAVDLRTHYFTPEQSERTQIALSDRLGPDYDVILEKTHMHVEYNVVRHT